MKKTAMLLLLVIFFPVVLFAGEVVTAKGMSFFEPGREVIAREKAIDEAKRAAIEKAIGVSVESQTVVENFEVVRDQIMSRSKGYLKNLQIINEEKSDFGTFNVTIQAEVEIAALVKDMDRFKQIASWQKNPRVCIVLDRKLNKAFRPSAIKTANLLTQKFKSNGLNVFIYKKGMDVQMGLFVNISLDISTRTTNYQGIDLTLNEISLSANITMPGDGEVLAASNAVKSVPGDNKLAALDKGANSCVDQIWRNLRKKLITHWEKELYGQRDIRLIIRKVRKHGIAKEYTAIFDSDVSGVTGSRLLSYRKRNAEYLIKYKGWPEQFLNEIQMSYFTDKYFEPVLNSIAGNKLVITIKKK